MATLMEFATLQLERNRGTRNTAPVDSDSSLRLPDPVVHWGSEGRTALESDGKRKAKLLVVCTHGGAALAAKDAIDPAKMKEIGTVLFAGPSLKSSNLAEGFRSGICSIWSSNGTDGTLFLFMGQEVADSRAYGVAKAVVENIVADRMVILDASANQNVDAASAPNDLIRFLQTEAAENLTPQPAAPPLETGVVVGGLSAALLSASQIRSRPAVLYLGFNSEPYEVITKWVGSATVQELTALLRSAGVLPEQLLLSEAPRATGVEPPPQNNLYL